MCYNVVHGVNGFTGKAGRTIQDDLEEDTDDLKSEKRLVPV